MSLKDEGATAVVWRGDIVKVDTDGVLPAANLCFTITESQQIYQLLDMPNRPLQFLALVDLNRIPLHLAAGPSMTVRSDSTHSITSLATMMQTSRSSDGSNDLPTRASDASDLVKQSSIAVLTQVDWSHDNSKDSSIPRITEILIYCVQCSRNYEGVDGSKSDISIYALPLSSDLLYELSTFDHAPIQPRSELNHAKDRLNNLFDTASDNRRRTKQKMSRSIGLAAANASSPASGFIFDGNPIKSNPVEEQGSLCHASRKRIQTVPVSAAELPLNGNRTLYSGSSRPSSRIDSSDTIEQSMSMSNSQITTHNGFEDVSAQTRNRQMVSRTVMAGMRLYGLQQKKRPSSRSSTHDTITELSETDKSQETFETDRSNSGATTTTTTTTDAEYKAVYHQLFKATIFAFRNRVESEILQPSDIRDVVDRLLTVFCTMPP